MSTFGEELKRERELREITLREVSEATKINMRYLESMESNEFENLPGGLFNRGFVRAYAQFIGVDPERMVTAYLAEEQQQAGNRGAGERGLLRGARRDREIAPTPRPARRWRWWILALVAALILAGAYVVYRWFSAGPSVQDRAAQTPTRIAGGGRGG